MSAPVLAIDPGREKCGIALLAADGAILYRAVVPTAALADTAAQRASAAGARIIMGDGTTSAAAKARMERAGYAVVLVDEYRTTVGGGSCRAGCLSRPCRWMISSR